ncbi:MAG: site-2 protease family protein [Polyangiaceae bacterium]|nr:site-2 protease family protein [Polyangiaceae bacterium]
MAAARGRGGSGVQLGRILGIQIEFDYSWLFIVFLMTWSLASAFMAWHPDWATATAIGTAFIASMLFFASVLVHELAHSIVARQFGVPVRKITLFLFGGISDIEHEPPSPKAEFWTAIVGPIASIALGIAFLYLAALVTRVPPGPPDAQAALALPSSPGVTLLLWLGPINILVGLFNLIPGFPLDGGRVLRSALWAATHDLRLATRWASMVGQAIGWTFVFLGVAIVFGAHVPFFGRGVVAGLWLAFIGWFLSAAAAQTWQRQLLHDLLHGIPVARLMRPKGAVVPEETTVADLVDRWMLPGDDRAFAVGNGDVLRGVVTFADVRRIARDAWVFTHVADVMTPADRVIAVRPYDDAAEGLEKMASHEVSQLPVLDADRRLVGMLRLRDIHRFIELHSRTPSERYVSH